MAMNSVRAYEYVFSTASLYQEDIFAGLYDSFVLLGSSLISTVSATFTIVIYILLFFSKLAIMVFPHFLSTVQAVIEFHRTKLTYSDLLVEFVVIVLCLMFILLKKRIINQWQIFVRAVERKSKAAAAAAPHVAFFTFAIIFSVAGRKFLVHLTSPKILPIITLLIPIYTTINSLQRISADKSSAMPSIVKKQKILKEKLTLWTVLAAYHTLATGLALISFSTRISSIIPILRIVIMVILMWAQLSHRFADIVFDASVPFLKYLAKKIPSSNFGAAQGNSLISVLKMMRLINEKHEHFLKSLQQDIIILLIAAAFCFFPWTVSYIGVIIVTLLFPAFKTSNNILEVRGKVITESEKVFWLEYWICWGLLWCLRCYGYHVWPSVLLLSAVWLQHSYFRGATWLRKSLESNLDAIMMRHDEIQKQKEVERLLNPTSTDDSVDVNMLTIKDDSGAIVSPSITPIKVSSSHDVTCAPDNTYEIVEVVEEEVQSIVKIRKAAIESRENKEIDVSSIGKKNL
jgi:hypothetical protein